MTTDAMPSDSFRARLVALPPLDPTGLRACQADAIEGVEASLRANHTNALVQMATGADKTYAACALAYRLLNYARAWRILFLVDRANLGTQTVAEFKGYRPLGSTLFFTRSSRFSICADARSTVTPPLSSAPSSACMLPCAARSSTRPTRKRAASSTRTAASTRLAISPQFGLKPSTSSSSTSATAPFMAPGARCSTTSMLS